MVSERSLEAQMDGQNDAVLLEHDGPVAIVTINNEEKLNALSYPVRDGLRAVLATVEDDPDVRVVILTGNGRAFCAGNDISLLDFDLISGRRDLEDTLNLFHLLERVKKPVIAAVNGYALGGGFELALAADLIVASEKATFGTPEARIGAAAGFAMMRLPAMIGKHRALEMFMTTDSISADQAQAVGLVSRVVPHDELLPAAKVLAHRIAAQAPLAIQLYKRTVNRHYGGEDLVFAIDACDFLFVTDDQREGREAFLQKRPAKFGGK